MNPEQFPTDPQQPVAYDENGRPLYAAPVIQPQLVHVSRAADPQPQRLSPELKARHEESVKEFPDLNLSDSEYVITNVPRHSLGMALPLITAGLLVVIILSLLFNLSAITSQFLVAGETINYVPFWIGGLLVAGLVLAGASIAVWVFRANRLVITNECVTQQVQTGLFAHNEQTTSLGSIEDVSYDQTGLIQMMFNYGSIRLATVGDETTYRFNYVVNPKRQVATINNAVEAFKNGRPMVEY
jgi:uncharacterized membrane protein YdbT with pleckstrin-like domain